jgi:hypothetical protein
VQFSFELGLRLENWKETRATTWGCPYISNNYLLLIIGDGWFAKRLLRWGYCEGIFACIFLEIKWLIWYKIYGVICELLPFKSTETYRYY